MKVSCLQENLVKGLSIVSRAVSTRSTLPVLANVLLETDN
ncbi:MAG TPA: DNA polymerase III subunit beta, partial [Anaerolineae bacterium]|nr:DNA polymerase III subunit beta [Anaerolineae bacterium]